MQSWEAVPQDKEFLARRELQHEVSSLKRCLSQLRGIVGCSLVEGGGNDNGANSKNTSGGEVEEVGPDDIVSQLSSLPASLSGWKPAPQSVVARGGVSRSDVARALERFVAAASVAARKQAECDAVQLLAQQHQCALAAAAMATVCGEEKKEKGKEKEEEEKLMLQLRCRDAERDRLRDSVEALQERLRVLQQTRLRRRGDGPAAGAERSVPTAETVANAQAMAHCQRELERQRQRQDALREALTLALARHKGRQVALAYCSGLASS